MQKRKLTCLLFSIYFLATCEWQANNLISQHQNIQLLRENFPVASAPDDKWTVKAKPDEPWNVNLMMPTALVSRIVGLRIIYQYLHYKMSEKNYSRSQNITFIHRE